MRKDIIQVSDNLNGTYTVLYSDMTEKKYTWCSVPKYIKKYIENATKTEHITLEYKGKKTPLYTWYKA